MRPHCGVQNRDDQLKLQSYALTHMFLELDHFFWTALCVMCGEACKKLFVVCDDAAAAPGKLLACAKHDDVLDCSIMVPCNLSKVVEQVKRISVIRASSGVQSSEATSIVAAAANSLSSASIGRVILSSAYLCIVPWVKWSPENHLYVTHKGLQMVVREALMVLARRGIHSELALVIVGKVMDIMRDRQIVLDCYAWDDMYLEYERIAAAAARSG